jgi:hypothetical protein
MYIHTYNVNVVVVSEAVIGLSPAIPSSVPNFILNWGFFLLIFHQFLTIFKEEI